MGAPYTLKVIRVACPLSGLRYPVLTHYHVSRVSFSPRPRPVLVPLQACEEHNVDDASLAKAILANLFVTPLTQQAPATVCAVRSPHRSQRLLHAIPLTRSFMRHPFIWG